MYVFTRQDPGAQSTSVMLDPAFLTFIKRLNGGVHARVGALTADGRAEVVAEMRVELLFVVGGEIDGGVTATTSVSVGFSHEQAAETLTAETLGYHYGFDQSRVGDGHHAGQLAVT